MRIEDIAECMGIPLLRIQDAESSPDRWYADIARPPYPDRASSAIDDRGDIVILHHGEDLSDHAVAEMVLHELMHIRAASFTDEGNSGLMALQYSCILLLDADQRLSCREYFSEYGLDWNIPGSDDTRFNEVIGGCEIGPPDAPEAEFVFNSPQWQDIVRSAKRRGLIDANLAPIFPSPKTIRRRMMAVDEVLNAKSRAAAKSVAR